MWVWILVWLEGETDLSFKVDGSRAHQVALIVRLLHGRRGLWAHHLEGRRGHDLAMRLSFRGVARSCSRRPSVGSRRRGWPWMSVWWSETRINEVETVEVCIWSFIKMWLSSEHPWMKWDCSASVSGQIDGSFSRDVVNSACIWSSFWSSCFELVTFCVCI